MTDISAFGLSIPARLGNSAWLDEGRLVLRTTPLPETSRLGHVRTSVLSYAVDAVAGIAVDTEPDRWTFTSDMTVHTRPVSDVAWVDARATVLRRGNRSSTCEVHLHDDRGRAVGYGVLGFANVPRRDGDPDKPLLDLQEAALRWGEIPTIERPLREAAGIVTLDAAAGHVELELIDELRNPAGALQGAMVGLVAECAAEDLLTERNGAPAFVTSLEIRYLAQARTGPICSTAEVLAEGPIARVLVKLTDAAEGRLVSSVVVTATTGLPTTDLPTTDLPTTDLPTTDLPTA